MRREVLIVTAESESGVRVMIKTVQGDTLVFESWEAYIAWRGHAHILHGPIRPVTVRRERHVQEAQRQEDAQ